MCSAIKASVTLRSGLQTLTFSYGFHLSLEGVELPSSLQTWTLTSASTRAWEVTRLANPIVVSNAAHGPATSTFNVCRSPGLGRGADIDLQRLL